MPLIFGALINFFIFHGDSNGFGSLLDFTNNGNRSNRSDSGSNRPISNETGLSSAINRINVEERIS